METLVELSWRVYPGAAVLALGTVSVAFGLARIHAAFLVREGGRPHAETFVAGLRLALVGAAVAGLGAAWVWQQLWLLLLALAIGGEELLETSFVPFILRRYRTPAPASG